MTHTVRIMACGTTYTLENVPDPLAMGILRWWLPLTENRNEVEEYYYYAHKDSAGTLLRAILLHRGNIAGIDVTPNLEIAGGVVTAPPDQSLP